ncbi:uncharacterized protein EV154DRAFT_584756 [Mucor mucedo]|uniref:uncharacterized protein n=1 Tax=Mucor mucedo TaxID=29922 RepID=UPI002220CE18|nr:uncharacterized protein EV154DRAFT_584756 [Mucor mucedo]KAI7892975.1 hypothetical protein EV154DRAFT_584756 [Mucor mucedo]
MFTINIGNVTTNQSLVPEDFLIGFGSLYSEELMLMDVSCDKRYAAYVTHQKNIATQAYRTHGNRKRLFLSRRKFVENGQHNIKSEALPYVNRQEACIEITNLVQEDHTEFHCKFLSISPDGKYVALSFYEVCVKNPHCLIFQMKSDGKFEFYRKLKCNGRAVFFKQKPGYSLALISIGTIEIYDEFPNNIRLPSYLFDSEKLKSHLREGLLENKAYIETASWFDAEGQTLPVVVEQLILISRHIRHNVIVTHFSTRPIVRVWSIEDGVRLTSFVAPNQHIMAFSKNYKYTAACNPTDRSINIYNVKSGLLVYQLKSNYTPKEDNPIMVSHLRFCYDGRYISVSGIENNSVFFEVWYVEAEKLVYRKTVHNYQKIPACQVLQHGRNAPNVFKFVQPFVMRENDANGNKYLKGVYTSFEDSKLTINEHQLDIDVCGDQVEDQLKITWIETKNISIDGDHEITNERGRLQYLKHGHFKIKDTVYMLLFGIHMVQLWELASGTIEEESEKDDKLIYIRAYKGPDYGVCYSFRENWRIQSFDSINFIGGISSGRTIVNITENTEFGTSSPHYHTEELFLPIDELRSDPGRTPSRTSPSDEAPPTKRFDYHKLESACQALHYLWSVKKAKKAPQTYINAQEYEKNLVRMIDKTIQLINLAVTNIDIYSNFFSTIAGSRTLAMLASFKKGREIIKLIIVQEIPISIFSYPRTIVSSTCSPPSSSYINKRSTFFYSHFSKKDSQKTFHNNSGHGSQHLLSPPSNEGFKYRGCSSKPHHTPGAYLKRPPIAENENVLTVLIDVLSYDIYKLLFNRILEDSKYLGPGCLSSLTDALLYLQEEGNTDLLLSSSQKLSLLVIKKNKSGVLKSEIEQLMLMKPLQKASNATFRNLDSYATMEQIKKYHGLDLIFYRMQRCYRGKQICDVVKGVYSQCQKFTNYVWENFVKEGQKVSRGSTKVCVVPLPHFITYSNLPEDQIKKEGSSNNDLITYKKRSAFARVTIDQNINTIFQQGDTVLEVILQYKWEHFARWRFGLICVIHLIYYVSYSTGVLFAHDLFDHGQSQEEAYRITSPAQICCLVLMFFSVSVLMAQEVRQFWKTYSKRHYFFSGYNWIDFAAIVLPIYTLIQMIYGWDYFNEVCSISTLVLWTHAILRMRVISYFGVTLEAIIQLCKSVSSVLFVMVLVLFAFTNAYIVLLRDKPDEYFQENYASNSNDTLILSSDISTSNGFVNLYKAFACVWFFVYGVWDPVNNGAAGDSKFLVAMSIVFSLVTVLIFFNLVIAMMASTVEQVKQGGKKAWVSHFAAVVSEIENIWCPQSVKRSRRHNPTYIYYVASEESVQKHEEDLLRESEKIKRKLKMETLSPSGPVYSEHNQTRGSFSSSF